MTEFVDVYWLPSGHIRRPQDGDLPGALGLALDQGEGPLLLALSAQDPRAVLPPGLAWLRRLSRQYMMRLSRLPAFALPALDTEDRRDFLETRPPVLGSQFIQDSTLDRLWRSLHEAADQDRAGRELIPWLEERPGGWHALGRIVLHLAENQRDSMRPFAFMATVISRIDASGQQQHLPLGRAIEERKGRADELLSLLRPLNHAQNSSDLIRRYVDSGTIYRPQFWTTEEAHELLSEQPVLEAAGLSLKLPAWWNQRPKVKVKVKLQEAEISTSLGGSSLLRFDLGLALSEDEEPLTEEELEALWNSTGSLVALRGRWVEVDRDKIKELLKRWETIASQAQQGRVSFGEASRMLAGLDEEDESSQPWLSIEADAALQARLRRLSEPQSYENVPGLKLTLRPYQQRGVGWLVALAELGLGGCLADDMGLGKTLQVLALLLVLKKQKRGPHLLVVPASLLGNWQQEAARAAPGLKFYVAHPSVTPREDLERPSKKSLKGCDFVITTYGTARRLSWIGESQWDLLICDEAQALKNPAAAQTKAIRSISASSRLALTGTPVENRLLDLYSIFDVTCPGLLGSSQYFKRITARMRESDSGYAPLRRLLQPYILRRLKSDPATIQDLPDKTEIDVYCGLKVRQANLYGKTVEDLENELNLARLSGDGPMKIRGLVLRALMRLKQICNHPTQALGVGEYDPKESGKMGRLAELCRDIHENQEKVLIFTQFQEIIPALLECLEPVFGRPGLSLHGGTAVKVRQKLVQEFQSEDGPPFFVLSLKAGGTGLNLTAAQHVIHFDRWWNPAVENQATDRAYRIGQKRNVLVHRFICRGTLEERIARMLEEKRSLAESVVGSGELSLTEMSQDELMSVLRLDLQGIAED